uniref:(northern house mosquito) hypothetical protein n=1 Tax=Culex pipiens TaxID=7175 RepID=A0A8D8CDX2_CULPI
MVTRSSHDRNTAVPERRTSRTTYQGFPYVRAVHEAPNQHQFSEPNAESGVPAPRHLGVARSWSDGPEQPPRHFPKISTCRLVFNTVAQSPQITGPAGTSLECQQMASNSVDGTDHLLMPTRTTASRTLRSSLRLAAVRNAARVVVSVVGVDVPWAVVFRGTRVPET